MATMVMQSGTVFDPAAFTAFVDAAPDLPPRWRPTFVRVAREAPVTHINKQKPEFGKYNFEQKVTYWFLFFSIGIMMISGYIMWFPETITRIVPGGIIPAAIMAHSTEAIATALFIVIWHFYHVHLERVNLSIFSGWLNETDMKNYHALEYDRVVNQPHSNKDTGEGNS